MAAYLRPLLERPFADADAQLDHDRDVSGCPDSLAERVWERTEPVDEQTARSQGASLEWTHSSAGRPEAERVGTAVLIRSLRSFKALDTLRHQLATGDFTPAAAPSGSFMAPATNSP